MADSMRGGLEALPTRPPQSWTVVIPVKAHPRAKSRFGGRDNSALALAMALDTVEAVLATTSVERVIVVTSADRVHFEALGAEVVVDHGDGLSAAIGAGLAAAGGVDSSAEQSAGLAADRTSVKPLLNSAVLLGDLPSLRATELEAALEAATRHPLSIVADADSIGTTLAAATAPHAHALHFGPGSCAAHVAAGYVQLDGAWPGLRRDVDLPQHLVGLELGPRTRVHLESGRA